MAVITQQQTIGLAPDDWAVAVPFTQFNPADGTLIQAVMTLTGTIQAAASFENLAPVAATINLGVASTISASAIGIGSLGSVSPVAAASVSLPAFQGTFDGVVDFSGPSAIVLPAITASQTATTAFVPAAAGAPSPIAGTGTFTANVTSTAVSTVEANGNFAVTLNTSAGATLSVAYEDVGSGGGSDQSGAASDFTAFYPLSGAPPIVTVLTSAPQTTQFAPAVTGWSGDAVVTQFDPSLGRLVAVLITAQDALSGTFAVENLDTAPGLITYTESAALLTSVPGASAPIVAVSTERIRFPVPGYDGTADFAGASGFSEGVATGTVGAGQVTTLTSAAALAAFTGTGTLSLPVDTAGSSVLTGPGSLSAISTQLTGGSISVQYVYQPGTAALPPSGGLGVRTVAGFTPVPAGGALVEAGKISATLLSDVAAPVFLAPGSSAVGAAPHQTFVVAPGASATILNFSSSAGDRLDLSALVSGADLGPALSNIGAFVGVTGTWIDLGGDTVTDLSVTGPSGAASLTLTGATAVSVVDLLNDHAFGVKGGV